MKKFTFIAAIAIMLSVMNSNAQIQFGIKAGLNIADAKVTAGGSVLTTSSRTTFQVGVIGINAINDQFNLDFGLMLSGKGTNYTAESVEVKPMYLEVPVNIGYKFDAGSVKVVPYGGLFLAYGVGGKYKQGDTEDDIKFGSATEDELKTMDLGLQLGGQVLFSNFMLYIQYQFGLQNISNLEGSDAKSRTLSLGAALLFGGK